MRQRWLARALVAGLHIGLLAAFWLHRPARLGEHGEQRLTTMRLIAPAPTRVPPADAAARSEPPRLAPPALIAPAPLDIPSDSSAATDATPAPGALPPSPSPAQPNAPLRLTLPPGYAASAAARNPALGDPRSNTARRTLEDRIADAAGVTGEWVVERTSDHRTLMRRGDTCMEMFRSRIADTDPFNNNVAPRTVPMYGQPYKCK
ncbi:hypothetical protein [Roseateles sp.]|uniref:hypothetical protein n=1 Tax=Roseateles sp. TaxID=1971397 RepID=UPI003BAB1D09